MMADLLISLAPSSLDNDKLQCIYTRDGCCMDLIEPFVGAKLHGMLSHRAFGHDLSRIDVGRPMRRTEHE